jgi:hypothetical protein
MKVHMSFVYSKYYILLVWATMKVYKKCHILLKFVEEFQ